MKLGIIITTFNRPQYLSQCLTSVKAADLSQVQSVLIVDDKSTDAETIRLINEFELDGVELIKAFSKENRSIKGSLLFGLDLLFNSCDVVTNLDGDAIVSKDAFSRLLELQEKFPSHILTGFNCSTKNKNGTVRHKILEQGEGWNKKYSVGGINMMFGKDTYLQVVRPALEKCLKVGGNWDHQACIISNEGYGKPVIVLEPSVVQHIGIDSAMGHSAGGEPPDEASDFIYDTPKDYGTRFVISKSNRTAEITHAKLYIPRVTLVAVDDNIEAIIKAADISCKMIQFFDVKLFSSTPSNDPRSVLIRNLGSKKEYSQFLLKELVDYIETPHFIVIQGDGFILDYTKWRDDFLEFDYCGAVWNFRDHKRIGNGGCSVRSRRLHQILKDDNEIVLKNDHIITNYAEDHNIGYIYHDYLVSKYGIKFAPEEVCNRFSFEGWGLKPPQNKYNGSFAFHGFSIDFSGADLPYIPYKLPNRNIL